MWVLQFILIFLSLYEIGLTSYKTEKKKKNGGRLKTTKKTKHCIKKIKKKKVKKL